MTLHPSDRSCRSVAASGALSDADGRLLCAALSRVFRTDMGWSLLRGAAAYIDAALGAAGSVPLRRLGCKQLGRLLAEDEPAGPDVTDRRVSQLLGALQDTDVSVAAVAEATLVAYTSSDPSRLAALLSEATVSGRAVRALASSRDTTVRMRLLSTLAGAAAASADAGAVLASSGIAQQLLKELENAGSDPLAALAALSLLRDLADGCGCGVAGVLAGLVAPRLPALAAAGPALSGALPLVADLLARALEAPQAGAGTHPTAVLATAGPLLSAVASTLDPSGDADAESEAAALDAAARLALPAAGAELLASAPAPVVDWIAGRALGRAPSPAIRVAALHCWAHLSGLERAGDTQRRDAALLSPPSEARLRSAVFAACAASGAPQPPAEALLAQLKHPFPDVRVAAYRFLTAMALRPWFAAEVANCVELMARLTDPAAEIGQQACAWRHSAILALASACQAAATGAADAGSDAAAGAVHRSVLAAAAPAVMAAARQGPFRTGTGAMAAAPASHVVATQPR